MQVWILMSGEKYEGGEVKGVYATKEDARDAFMAVARSIPYALDAAKKDDEDGSLYVEGGCDWVSLEPHDVNGRPQITS